MSENAKTVAIIGAGIVGVSTAIHLQRAGHKVILIDRKGPAEGTSYGNGGVLASCSIVPVTGPGLIGKAPRMALDRNQPLFIKWGYLPRLMPWLMRYLSHANAKDTKRIAEALMPIVGDSLSEHQSLAAGTGAEKWISPSDYLYIYNDRAHYESDSFGWSIRRGHGFEWTELEGQAFHDYDPVFAKELGFAACMPDHGRITDPGQYVKDLAAHCVHCGGELIIGDVNQILEKNGIFSGVRTSDGIIDADHVVIAAGVWSKTLAQSLGIHVPMETERGYHLELWDPSVMPATPVMVASGKFVATPMDGRLRLAGIVEFGGLEAEPSRRPFELLEENIRRAIPGLNWKEKTEWMGHRPAPTDSIPLIGEIPGIKRAWLGFGHHHVGLTGGPKTGRILSQLITGSRPNIDMNPYSPSRFAAG